MTFLGEVEGASRMGSLQFFSGDFDSVEMGQRGGGSREG
jgi:hypothetical protein